MSEQFAMGPLPDSRHNGHSCLSGQVVAPAPANVLLIGGKPATLQTVETILDELGLNLVRADSIDDALRRLAQEDYAVALFDVQTPGSNGLGAARLIRERPETRHLPLIFIRPLHDSEFPADLAYTLGAVDYLEEPLIPVILRAKVSGFVELFHHKERMRQMEKEAVERQMAEEHFRAEVEQQRRHAAELARVNADLAFEVAERRRAEAALRRSEQLYRAIGESIDYGVWVCDPAGCNIYASPSFLKLVGLTQEECAAFGWGNALHPDEAEETLAAWRECVRTEANWDREHRFRGVDGLWHTTLARGVPVRDDTGEVIYWAGINLDIDRLKQAEEALRQADRRKDEFLAMLAHELRNPLAPLRNSLTVLGLRGEDAAVREQALPMAERQVEQLTRLLDDLLDLSRIRQGKLVLKTSPVNLNEIVAHAIETVRPAVEGRRHNLEVGVPSSAVPLTADPVRLQQVFVNLLTNACRYTPPGGFIRLTVDVEGDEAVVRVRDTGIGLPPEMLTGIFTLYTQTDRAREQDGSGLGIGLALVRGLVTGHGGSITAHSEGPGRGSEFVVRLPLLSRKTPQPAEAAPRNTTDASPNLRILVVEDNEDAATSMAFLLEAWGHQAVVAHDGPSALRAARSFQPGVAFVDIGLPGMDGHEVGRRLRQETDEDALLLVALTGHGMDDHRRLSEKSGFAHHLVKPVDPDAIRDLLVRFAAGVGHSPQGVGE